MTTSGPVADPSPVPTKAVAGRYGSAKGKSDVQPSADEGGQGFGEVMSKLQRNTGAEPGRGNSKEAMNAPQPALKSDRAVVDASADLQGNADVVLDLAADLSALADTDEVTGTSPPDAAPQAAATTPTAAIKDLAALVVMMPAQAAAGGNAEAEQGNTTAAGTDAAAATRALLDAMSAATGDKAPEAPKRQPTEGEDGKQQAVSNASGWSGASTVAFPKASPSTAQEGADFGVQAMPDVAPELRSGEKPRSPNTKATVLQQEAHFAPVVREAQNAQSGAFSGDGFAQGGEAPMPDALAATSVDAGPPTNQAAFTTAMSPASQIAEHIAAAASGAPPTNRSGTIPDVPGGKSPFKVLSIQLQPADLGTVTVRMELKDGELTLHVEADRADTADLIRGDQDTLSNLLRVAGYSVDAGSIKVMEGDRSLVTPAAGQHGAQTNLQSSSQGQSGSSERQGQAHRGGQSPSGGQSGGAPSRNEGDETGINRTGRGLFV